MQLHPRLFDPAYPLRVRATHASGIVDSLTTIVAGVPASTLRAGAGLGLFLLACVAVPGMAMAADSGPVDFRKDVLPILSDNCFLCHGPDSKTRKADLRLDVKEGALRTTDPVIVPGKSGESELVSRVTSTGPRRGDAAPQVGQDAHGRTRSSC